LALKRADRRCEGVLCSVLLALGTMILSNRHVLWFYGKFSKTSRIENSHMDLYKLTNNKLQSIDSDDFKLEEEIQRIVEANFRDLFGLQFVTSEFSVGDFRLDSLCFDEENNSFVVVEYKRGSNYSVIDQGLLNCIQI